jgi:hypothetical protein
MRNFEQPGRLEELLAPAIRLAEEGYVVPPRSASDWASQEKLLQNNPNAAPSMHTDSIVTLDAMALSTAIHAKEVSCVEVISARPDRAG